MDSLFSEKEYFEMLEQLSDYRYQANIGFAVMKLSMFSFISFPFFAKCFRCQSFLSVILFFVSGIVFGCLGAFLLFSLFSIIAEPLTNNGRTPMTGKASFFGVCVVIAVSFILLFILYSTGLSVLLDLIF